MPVTPYPMPDSILRTKLHRPPVPRDYVCRPRLHPAIDHAAEASVVLVSAPAGYGKSLLVSHWIELRGESCAWVSLDAADADLDVFLEYLLAAVEAIVPNAFPKTRLLVRVPEVPPVDILVRHLVNELDLLDQPCSLVLDDYHHIPADSDVHQLLQKILERPPHGVRLFLIARRDPPLELAGVRAQGRLTEVRLADLRFTPAESRDLLQAIVGLDVTEAAIANLEREIEGWAVGLRLVALAARQAPNPDQALRTLSGGILHAKEYLISEVIDRQPPQIRDCLLKTALLERFCPALCEAVCAPHGMAGEEVASGQAFVRTLQECNLFVIPLDAEGIWFRFHHLFHELLEADLGLRLTPEEIAVLHLRASRWLEANGLIEEAVRHAMAAGLPLHAAEIIERQRRPEQERGGWLNVERWLALLPGEVVEQRPGLLQAMAFVRHYRHQYRAIALIVQRLEAMSDDEAFDDLSQGELKLFQGALLFWGGHLTEARERLLAADALIAPTYGTAAGLVQVYIALTGQALGQSSRVLQDLDERIGAAQELPAKYRANLANARSLVHLLSGDLEQVIQGAHLVFTIANERDLANNYAWGHYVAASAHFRALQLDAAVPHFLSVLDHRYVVQPRAAVDAMAGLALAYQSLQQGPAADAVADDMLAYAKQGNDLDLLYVAQSARARLALNRGDTDAASRWALSHEVAVDAASLVVWLENPAITRARVLVAIEAYDTYREAATLLAALAEGTRKRHNVCQQIDILVLRSLALDGLGQPEKALSALRQAVRLGQRGGWMRPFAEAGSSLAPLLHRLAAGPGPDHRDRAYL
ncbi:MAG: hypothetical protein WAT23_16630, partial [Chromatiaceae bacterium]